MERTIWIPESGFPGSPLDIGETTFEIAKVFDDRHWPENEECYMVLYVQGGMLTLVAFRSLGPALRFLDQMRADPVQTLTEAYKSLPTTPNDPPSILSIGAAQFFQLGESALSECYAFRSMPFYPDNVSIGLEVRARLLDTQRSYLMLIGLCATEASNMLMSKRGPDAADPLPGAVLADAGVAPDGSIFRVYKVPKAPPSAD